MFNLYGITLPHEVKKEEIKEPSAIEKPKPKEKPSKEKNKVEFF